MDRVRNWVTKWLTIGVKLSRGEFRPRARSTSFPSRDLNVALGTLAALRGSGVFRLSSSVIFPDAIAAAATLHISIQPSFSFSRVSEISVLSHHCLTGRRSNSRREQERQGDTKRPVLLAGESHLTIRFSVLLPNGLLLLLQVPANISFLNIETDFFHHHPLAPAR